MLLLDLASPVYTKLTGHRGTPRHPRGRVSASAVVHQGAAADEEALEVLEHGQHIAVSDDAPVGAARNG